MVSQETKDQIDKEALKEYPIHYGNYTFQGDYISEGFDANAHNRAAFIRFSTRYAEKLEEKDKAYNELGVKFDKEVERWQERDANEFEKRRVLEVELAQLREIIEKMTKDLEFYLVVYSEVVMKDDKERSTESLEAYAEWCKQNKD